VPTFAEVVTATAYADTEADYNKAAEKIPAPFERLERALQKQGNGPPFNGARYSLVDAADAPFLLPGSDQEDRTYREIPPGQGMGQSLINRPSTHSFPPEKFEALYRRNVERRNKWVSRFIESAQIAAE
jgi:glutathione S-transferase